MQGTGNVVNMQRRAGKPTKGQGILGWPPSTLFGQTNQGQANVVRANQANMPRQRDRKSKPLC